MTDTTKNTDIINQLLEEQKKLIVRLKAVRNAIIGFGGEISNEDFEGMLEVEEDVITSRPLVIPDEFNKDLSQIHKIAYALKALGGEAYVTEIADKITELENLEQTENEKIIFRRRVTLLTSYLYRDNRLKVKKDGNKYKYRLIE